MMTNTETGTAEILLVEDNRADACLVDTALQDTDIRSHLNVCSDGLECMDLLEQVRVGADSVKRPDLIILDLNLPGKNGREILGEIKADPALMNIPVVIFSTSGSERDIRQAYVRKANCYVVKPMDLDGFMGAVRAIESFWLRAVVPAAGRAC